jgi:iron(III) transport system substrate-binding protein
VKRSGNSLHRAFFTFSFCLLPFTFLCAFLSGCGNSDAPGKEVVLYTSVDQPIAASIVKEFEQKTGVHVVLVTDAEATKSVGLAERIRAEKANPQADVFWGNEPFHTISLASESMLQPYESPVAKDIPNQFKDSEHRWASNGLRARVFAVATESEFFPNGIEDLLKPEVKGRVGIARPTAGTTGGHVAALYVLWGDERAAKFFRALRDNDVKMLGGNSVVAQQVGSGNLLLGLTDNDDCAAAVEGGGKLTQVVPDQGDNGVGTLMVPTTIGLVAGAKHADAAKQLIDFLLSADVEGKMIDQKFVGWSVRDVAAEKVKAMDVDLREVAKAMPRAVREATAILEGRE